jgi:hypothetical protein
VVPLILPIAHLIHVVLAWPTAAAQQQHAQALKVTP